MVITMTPQRKRGVCAYVCVCGWVCVCVMCADSTAQELCREEGKEFPGTSNLAPDKPV